MAQKSLRFRITAFLLSTAVFVSVPLSTLQAEDEDLNNQLSGVQQQMDSQNAKKADAEARIGTISQQLHQIENELAQATANLKNYQNQRQMRNRQINGLLSKSGIDKIELFTGQNYIQPLMKLFKNRVKK